MSKPLPLFHSIAEFTAYRDHAVATSERRLRIGFVPTMGALHEGHASLLRKSASENDFNVLSIFVNPTQFNNSEDLEKYPKTLDDDLKIAAESGADAVLSPHFDEIYPDKYLYKVTENKFSKMLCGAHRPGHFDGVLTIVMKLLNICRADHAYFGEKDYQQLQLIKDMTQAFFLPTQIVACPTSREKNGLAMSSRNRRLTPKGRLLAPEIYKAISSKISSSEASDRLKEMGIQVEYLDDIDGRRFVAAFIDGVRLIDNVKI